MKQDENYRYNTAIADIANWQYTTYIRTHYNIKPHTADKMVQGLLKYTDIIDGIYFTLEDDSVIYGGGTNDTFARNVSHNINHMHLMFALNEKTDVSRLRKKINHRVTTNGIIKTESQTVTGNIALRHTILKGLKLNQKALGGVEPIRDDVEIVKYINKYMSNPQAHHNYFFKGF